MYDNALLPVYIEDGMACITYTAISIKVVGSDSSLRDKTEG